ncbi:MAG: DUF423 domain-containing protein [Bacteroidetes bacterium]|nr:DUF423 domain-containing protein [Bacteroidota bacterium]
MKKYAWASGSLLGLLAVVLGAFGAHALRDILTEAQLATWELAVRYQMYHALALLAVAAMGDRLLASWSGRGVLLFVVGVLLFSGSLYGYVLSGWKFLAVVTPVGGLSLILGWACVFRAGWRR